MSVEDFFKELNPHSEVFELNVEYEYTEKQLLLFAKLYHESELKNETKNTKDVLMEVQSIYDAHKLKLNNLKENRSKSDEENWTDAEIKSADDQIVILASVLSDLNRNVLSCQQNVSRSVIEREFTTDDVIKQHELIGKWLEETKKAYEMEHVEDGHIISYLAQKELGFHQPTFVKNEVAVCESCGEVNDCHHSKCTRCLAKSFMV